MKPTNHLLHLVLHLSAVVLAALSVAKAESFDAGRGGVFPAAVTDRISFSSPTQAMIYNEMPSLTGRVKSSGMDTLTSVIEQLDASGKPCGYVKWGSGEILPHTDSNFLFGGAAHVRSWNLLSTGPFTLPALPLPAGNYRLRTMGSIFLYGIPLTVGDARVSFRVEPPYSFTDLQGGDTIAITSPANGQTLPTAAPVQVSGEADGDHVEAVVIGLARFNATGEIGEIYNWIDQTWEPSSDRFEFRHGITASGLYRWTANLPEGLAEGNYRIVAYGVSGSTVHAIARTDITLRRPEPEPIIIDSPVSGAASTSTPAFRGILATEGVEMVLGLIVRFNEQRAITGLVHWETGAVMPYEEASFNVPGLYGQLPWNGRAGSFAMTGPDLSPSSYCFVAYGFKGPDLVAVGFADFRIEESAPLIHPPIVTTSAASAVTFNRATLNAGVNPNGFATTTHFEYGLTTGYGTSTENESTGAGNSAVPKQAVVGNLTPNTTYHYRLVATNSFGTTNGPDRTFTTPDNAVVGTWAERTVARTLPTTIGGAVEIGTLTFTGGTGIIEAAVSASGSGWSVAKRYLIPIRYNLGGGSSAATWVKVLPTHDTGPYGVNDFALDVNVSGKTALLRLRTVGSTSVAATAKIAIKTTGLESFVNSSGTAAAALPAQTLGGNAVEELAGKAGIGVAPAGNAVLDVNGGETRGLRLRARSTPGAPTAGAWNTGTIILDSAGNLFICTASGTPGAWKKIGN